MQEDKRLTINGQLLLTNGRMSLKDLLVAAIVLRDEEPITLGSVESDAEGRFEIPLQPQEGRPHPVSKEESVFFVVSRDGQELHSTRNIVEWRIDQPGLVFIEIALNRLVERSIAGRVTTERGLPVEGLKIIAFAKRFRSEPDPVGDDTTVQDGFYQIDYSGYVRKPGKQEQLDLYVECPEAADPNNPEVGKSELIINAPSHITIDVVVSDDFKARPTQFEELDNKLSGLIGDRGLKDLPEEDFRYLEKKLERETSVVRQLVRARLFREEMLDAGMEGKVPDAAVLYLLAGEDAPNISEAVNRPRQTLHAAVRRAINSGTLPKHLAKDPDAIVDKIKRTAVDLAMHGKGDQNGYSLRKLVELHDGLSDKQRSLLIEAVTLNERPLERLWHEFSTEERFVDLLDHIPEIRELFNLRDATRQNQHLIAAIRGEKEPAQRFATFTRGEWLNFLGTRNIKPPLTPDGKRLTAEDYADILVDGFKYLYPAVARVSALQKNKVLRESDRPSKAVLEFVDRHPGVKIGKVPIRRYLRESGILAQFEGELKKIGDEKKRARRKGEQNAFVRELQHIELAYVLAPDSAKEDGAAVLMAMDLNAGKKRHGNGREDAARKIKADSAIKIARSNRARFIGQWMRLRTKQTTEEDLDKKRLRAEVEQVYAVAKRLAAGHTMHVLNATAKLDAAKPAMATSSSQSYAKSLVGSGMYDASVADLQTLFGTVDYCECAHCQSIYGPSAYLDEIIRDVPADAQVLYRRRPDIEKLHRNCTNTNTKLPYIDLALELLEQMAVSQLIDDWQTDRQTTLSEQELELRPEHEDPLAYVQLSVAPFPMLCPWDKWFEEAGLYLNHMQAPLYRLVEAFQPVPDSATEANFDYWEHRKAQVKNPQTVRAHLGMAWPIYDLVTKVISNSDAPLTYQHKKDDLWPFFTLPDVNSAESLALLMDRLGFWGEGKNLENVEEKHKAEFKLMRQILGCRYVQDAADKEIRVVLPEGSCNFKEAKIENLNKEALFRITRFEHLRRILDWTPDELNWAIAQFSGVDWHVRANKLPQDAINDNLLLVVSVIKRLQSCVNVDVSVNELLSWWGPKVGNGWGPINTGAGIKDAGPFYAEEGQVAEPARFYDQVFLNRSNFPAAADSGVLAEAWRHFELNNSRTELKYLGAPALFTQARDFSGIIAAALNLPETEIRKLIDLVEVENQPPFVAPLGLGLKQLAACHRFASLARVLQLDMDDLRDAYLLIRDVSDPFDSPEDALLFVETVQQFRLAGLSIRDLAYISRHWTRSEKELEYIDQLLDNFFKEPLNTLGETSGKSFEPVNWDFTSNEAGEWIVQRFLSALGFDGGQAGGRESTLDWTMAALRRGDEFVTDADDFLRLTWLTTPQRQQLYQLIITTPRSADHYRSVLNYFEVPAHLELQKIMDRLGYAQPTINWLTGKLGDTAPPPRIELEERFRVLSGAEIDGAIDLWNQNPGSGILYAFFILALESKVRLAEELIEILAGFVGLKPAQSRQLAFVGIGNQPAAGPSRMCLCEAVFVWLHDRGAMSDDDLRGHMLRFHKAAFLVDELALHAKEIAYIKENPALFHGFDFRFVPIQEIGAAAGQTDMHQWRALASLADQRQTFAEQGDDLISIFGLAKEAFEHSSQGHLGEAGIVTEQAIDQLAALVKVGAEYVTEVLGNLGYVTVPAGAPVFKDPYRLLDNPDALTPVVQACALAKRIGQSPAKVVRWIKDTDGMGQVLTLDASFTELVQYKPGTYSTDFQTVGNSSLLAYKNRVVSEVRNAVRASSTVDAWQEVARDLQDKMRVMQRDRLLGFILNREFAASSRNSYRITDVPSVSDFLLIDPLMQPCMDTTRLKQATGSVQLLIERILMGLEQKDEDLRTEAYDNQLDQIWKWKRRYRFWEAQMKVLLYPENWLEPELRDDKTPFFEEFESEIAQSGINQKGIENAFKAYLQKIEEVANIDVMALKQQFDSWSMQRENYKITVTWMSDLHVLARTKEKSGNFYYRKRKMNRIWLPWRRVDLDIEEDVTLLTFYRGRPYIFWPRIKEGIMKLGQDNSDDRNNDKNNYRPFYEINFNWSSYRDGRWTKKEKSTTPAILMYDWDHAADIRSALIFRIITEDNDKISIDISVNGQTEQKNKYIWNNDKFEELFLPITYVLDEIDWEFMMPGWDLFKADGMTQSHIDMMRDQIERVSEFTEKQLKLNLYADPQDPNPFSFIKNQILTSYIEQYFAGHPIILFFGVLGAFFNLPWQFRNKSEGQNHLDKGLYENDLYKVKSSLLPMVNVNKESISLYKHLYRYLVRAGNWGDDNDLIMFAKMFFDGYKLLPRVQNSLGLRGIVEPQSNTVQFQGLFNIFETQNADVHSGVVNSADLDDISFVNNHTRVTDSGDPHQIVLKIGNSDSISIEASLPEARIVRDDTGWHLVLEDKAGGYYFRQAPSGSSDEYECEPFYYPEVEGYNTVLDNENLGPFADRVQRILNLEESQISERSLTIAAGDNFQFAVDSNTICFDLTRCYGGYNWEIFFHIPLLVATRLSQDKQFGQAQQWYHYIFNPLKAISLENEVYDDGLGKYDAAHYWHFLPLHRLGLAPSVSATEIAAHSDEWSLDPFNPHVVARNRHGAYQYAVVMRYLDNLLAWGDHLFAQNTIESINEAYQKYALAARILGPRPKVMPKEESRRGNGTGSLAEGVGSAELMAVAPETWQHTMPEFGKMELATDDTQPTDVVPMDSSGCIPPNEKLLSYWDTLADRLFKIRNCRNIEGEEQELPIFERPIDPALLVRGKALGVDLVDLLSELYAPVPPYRFKVMFRKAMELCGEVRALGKDLLTVIEKRDAEQLSLLRSRHEREILSETRTQKQRQIRESETNLKATMQSLETTKARQEYYRSRPFENQNEKAEVAKRNVAHGFNLASQIVALGASVAYAIPNIHQSAMGSPTIETGGQFVGNGLKGMSDFLRLISDALSHEATMHSIQGGRERRMDDWQFQAQQAKSEITQLEKQILASEIRVAIAEHDLELHRKQEDNAEEVEDFLKTKFSGYDLYDWMISRTSDVYFQAYKLTVDAARMAEMCYRREVRDGATTYISANYWDNLKQGLMAGERLDKDLRRMDADYDRVFFSARKRELSKDVSLNRLVPFELDRLRYEGVCQFHVPELLFDLDFPHHYQRTIKSIRVSIPCVVGPYASVPCQLRLLGSSVRTSDTVDGEFVADSTRPGQVTTIALSTGQGDSGLHQFAPDGDRYLPFELRGVDSVWELKFPSDLISFDRMSITDVIFHIQYTALEGVSAGQQFDDRKTAITAAYAEAVSRVELNGMGQRFDIRREFPDLWSRFRETGAFSLPIERKMFPYLAAPIIDRVKGIWLTAETSVDMGSNIDLTAVTLGNRREFPQGRFTYDFGPSDRTIPLGQTLDLALAGGADPKLFKEMIAVLFYDVSPP